MTSTRTTYKPKPSGRADPLRFPLGMLLALAVALGLGWILAWLFRQGWYFIGIVPLFAALALGGMVAAAITLGRCRNRVLGLLLALIAGLVLHASYFHFDLLDLIGYRHALHLELLPKHIHLRLATDTTEDVAKKIEPAKKGGKALPPQGPPKLDDLHFYLNVFLALIDLGIFTVVPMAIAWPLCRRAYSETEGRWLHQSKTLLAPEAAAKLHLALEENRLAEFAASAPNLPLAGGARQCALLLERLPGNSEAAVAEPAYLTLTEVNLQARGFSKALFRQIELTPAETQQLLQVYPALRDAGDAAAIPVSAADTTPGVGVPAQLMEVPPPYGRQVLTSRNVAKMSVIGLSTLLLPIALGIGCMSLIVIYGEENLETWQIVALAIAGVGLMALGAILAIYFSDFLPSRFFYSLSRKYVRERPDAWVDPDDANALYIQVIPRVHWSRVMFENANDIGFLKIDAARRLLLYEGDKERWVIPAESLVSCELEKFAPGQGQTQGFMYSVVVIRMRLASRQEERPISLRHIKAKRRGPKEQERETRELCEKIRTLLGREQSV